MATVRVRGSREPAPKPQRPPTSSGCASCGLPVDGLGRHVTEDVAFCAECLERAHPDEDDELGVVD